VSSPRCKRGASVLWWFDSIRPHHPGDEALVAERLACNEEERVRLPPSPLFFAPALDALAHEGLRHSDLVTYRRSKNHAELARAWRDFTVSERSLFDQAGLPGLLVEDQDAFEDFLMHGFLTMPGGHAGGTWFSTDELNVSQRDALDELAALYMKRVRDPGVSLGPRHEIRSLRDDKPFGLRLAETIAWCMPRVDAGNPATSLRSERLRPWVLEQDRAWAVKHVLDDRAWPFSGLPKTQFRLPLSSVQKDYSGRTPVARLEVARACRGSPDLEPFPSPSSKSQSRTTSRSTCLSRWS
jgi:hypothetical protein